VTNIVSVNELIEGLSQVFAEEFTGEQVLEYLMDNRVEASSLGSSIRFSERTYTRNLVCKGDLFESVLLCWEPGQHSPVHRHLDQWGWMMVLKGQLVITRFIKLRSEIIESDEPDINWSRVNSMFLKEDHHYTVAEGDVVQEVTKPETIHKTENPPLIEQQAISLHICTGPSETSVIYDVENHRCRTVRMRYV